MKALITKNAVILGGFALIATGLISITDYFTAPKILLAQEKQLLSILNELVPDETHTNELHSDCILVENLELLGKFGKSRVFRARNDEQDIATIIEATTPNGYSGDIDFVVAVSYSGSSLGARVLNHKETPGLGDKIDLRVSNWILSFENVPLKEENLTRWQVKKDGGKFDQFTGATITPRAVVEGVKNVVLFAQQNRDILYKSPSNCLTNDRSIEPTVEET